MGWEVYRRNMCRACMNGDCILLPMYDEDTADIKNLPEKLQEVTLIHIDRNDGLPQMLCTKCAYRTITSYNFRLQVQKSEEKLRKMFDVQVEDHKEEKEKMEENVNEQDCIMLDNELMEKKFFFENNEMISINHASSINEELSKDITERKNKDEQSLEIISLMNFNHNNEMDDKIQDHLVNIIDDSQQDKLYNIKNELDDQFCNNSNSQDVNCTIVYIGDIEMESIKSENHEDLCKSRNENIDIKTLFSKDNFEESKTNDEFLDTIYISDMESKDTKTLNIETDEAWQLISSDGPVIIDQVDKINFDVQRDCNTTENIESKESDDSDSDYFIDPKDNILGSLNDMITRIKEIKTDNKTEYQCTLCLQNYDKLTGVLLHTIDNHVPSSGPFFCVVCEMDCNSHKELRTHVKKHTGKFPYICFMCDKAYASKRYLKRHMVCHTDLPKHRCSKCGVRFKTKVELENHIATHVHGAPYTCSQCSRLFNHKGNYKRHLITHLDPQGLHLPKYPCMVCEKRFLNNRTLQTHMRVHTGEKPFKCEICNRKFSQQGNLLNHLRIHSNPRSYTCEVCGKRFNQRATLKDHSLIHTGEKPHICNVCGVAFTFSAALRRHMWNHASGKPFGCEICPSRFVGKYDLRRHMQIHSDRPRTKQKKNDRKNNNIEEVSSENITEEVNTETVLVEQVLLNQDVTQVIPQEEAEKENVDALFNLIRYD